MVLFDSMIEPCAIVAKKASSRIMGWISGGLATVVSSRSPLPNASVASDYDANPRRDGRFASHRTDGHQLRDRVPSISVLIWAVYASGVLIKMSDISLHEWGGRHNLFDDW
jgi:hypothetical protein